MDATGELLLKVLKYRPFLIKPNKHELEELFDCSIRNNEDIRTYAGRLQDMGAENVLVSLGKEGAILLSKDGRIYESLPPEGEMVNSVGAGDSMVAGFLTGYLRTGSYEDAFYMGLCAGSASAYSESFAEPDEVSTLMRSLGKDMKL